MKILGVNITGLREEIDTETLPNGYQEIDKSFLNLKKEHKLLFLNSGTQNFESIDRFEALLKDSLETMISENFDYLNSEYQKDDEDYRRLVMIIHGISKYGEEQISQIIDEIRNPKNNTGFFKSLIANILK